MKHWLRYTLLGVGVVGTIGLIKAWSLLLEHETDSRIVRLVPET